MSFHFTKSWRGSVRPATEIDREERVSKKIPLHPKYPERICWGCDKYCSVDDLRCGNGSDRTQHPIELLGDDWYEHGDWGIEAPLIKESNQ